MSSDKFGGLLKALSGNKASLNKSGVAGSAGGIEYELLQEMASSLARAGNRVADGIAQLGELQAQIDSEPAESRGALIEQFNELRSHVVERKWELLVQREAIGFRRHDDVEAAYPIPARLAPA